VSPIQKATAASAENRIGRAHQLTQALDLQYHCYKIALTPSLDAIKLASLVRSWVAVTDCVREIRGIPKAGQLRPDLDPAQAMKALKRIRERLPVDIAGHKSALADGPAPSPTTAKSNLARKPKQPPITEANESPLDLPDEETPSD
jgi:hypothetical protein